MDCYSVVSFILLMFITKSTSISTSDLEWNSNTDSIRNISDAKYSQENLSKLLPSLKIFPKFQEPDFGQRVSLVCTTNDLDPDPDPKSISWSFEPLLDRTELRKKTPVTAEYMPQNVSILGNVFVIWSMSIEHCGIYKCTVHLQDFNLTAQASAEIAAKPTKDSEPQVFLSPELLRISPNISATIICEILGYPPPIIEWYRLDDGVRYVRLVGSEYDFRDRHNDVSPTLSVQGLRTEYISYADALFFCDERDPPCKAPGPVTGISLLRIDKSHSDHQGQYVCRASNSVGSDQASTMIDVEFGESPHVRIPDHMKEQTLELNGTSKVTATYECIVESGKPVPRVRWLRPASYGDNSARTGMDVFDLNQVSSATSNVSTWQGEDGKTFYLSISTSSLNDQGEYVCLAENERGRHSALAGLHLQRPVAVRITQTSPYVARINDSFQFDCISSGYPLPLDIEWSRQDKGAFFSLISRQQGNLDDSHEKAILKFDRVSAEESGEYTCNARHPTDPSVILRDTIMLLVEDSSKQESKVKTAPTNSPLPRLMIRPTRTSAPIGSNVTLDCLAISGLQPTIVEWIAPPNLVLGSPGGSSNMSDQLGISTPQIRPYYRTSGIGLSNNKLIQFGSKLKVINVSKSHEGVYQCRGRNKVGVELAPALIRVIDQPESREIVSSQPTELGFDVPINELNRTKIAKAGSNIELKCQVDGVNQPVTSWSRDGMELPKSSVQIDHNLWIKNVSNEDGGLYVCSAKSKIPNKVIQAKINLVVQGGYEDLPNLELIAKIIPSKSSVHSGESITLECIVSKPNSSQNQDSNGKVQEEILGIEKNIIWTNLHTSQSVFQDNVYIQDNLLIIYELRPENSATYRCNYNDYRQFVDYKLNVPGNELISVNQNIDQTKNSLPSQSRMIQVGLGGQLNIDCEHDEVTEEYYWTKGQDTKQVGEARSSLMIQDMTPDLADWYHCHIGKQGQSRKIIKSYLVHVVVPVARFTQQPISFISLPTISGAEYQLNLEMKFLPTRDHGLILYNGQQAFESSNVLSSIKIDQARPSATGDYILLGIHKGFLEFRFELGDGVTILRSNQPVSMNEWHRLVIERNRQGAIMWVDQQAPVRNNSNGKFFNLNLDSVLYVGGSQFFLNRANLNRSTKFFGYTRGFVGCISQLRIARNEINLMARNRIVSLGIYECDKSECQRDFCGKHGVCQVDRSLKVNKPMNTTKFSSPSSDLRCICHSGFVGHNCDEEYDPSYSHGDKSFTSQPTIARVNEAACDKLKPCSPNGTLSCDSEGQTSYKCHCRLGFLGKTCSQSGSFTDEKSVFFSGRSYLKLHLNNPTEASIYNRHSQAGIHSKPLEPSADNLSGSGLNEPLEQSTIANLSSLESISEQTNLTFLIHTESKYGVLFYMGQINEESNSYDWSSGDTLELGKNHRLVRTKSVIVNLLNRISSGSNSDYLALALVDGHVELSYELGSGMAIIRSTERINDNQWHHIQVLRNGTLGQLTIDGTSVYQGNSPGKHSILNTQSKDIFIGGLSPFADQTTSSNAYLLGFSGCIMNIQLNTIGPLNLVRSDHITQIRSARNIEPCDHSTAAPTEWTTSSSVRPTQKYRPYTPKPESDDPDEI